MLWLKQGITDEKGAHDVILLGIFCGVCAIIGFTAADLYWNHKFDAKSFGESLAWLLGGGGSGYGLRRWAEKYDAGNNPIP